VAQDGKGPILRSCKHGKESSDTRNDEKRREIYGIIECKVLRNVTCCYSL